MTSPRVLVIVNANARRIRRRPGEVARMRSIAERTGVFALTRSVSELDGVLRTALDRADIVALAGGDGTNHVTLTRLERALDGRPFPPIALLGGGTMNIVARHLGVAASPSAALRRLCDAAPEGIRSSRHDLLRVQTGDFDALGFIFGAGLVVNFLREYYRQVDPTPADAGAMLARAAWSAVTGGELASRLLAQLPCRVVADGDELFAGTLTALLASSQQHLGLGFRPFVRARDLPGAFEVVAIDGGLTDVATALPGIRLGRPLPAQGFRATLTRRLEVSLDQPASFFLDGDLYPEAADLSVTTGPTVDLVVA